MIAKKVPIGTVTGKRGDVASMYGLTLAEFNAADVAFLQSEGFAEDGHECMTLHEWLTYTPAKLVDKTPWQKGDDQNEN